MLYGWVRNAIFSGILGQKPIVEAFGQMRGDVRRSPKAVRSALPATKCPRITVRKEFKSTLGFRKNRYLAIEFLISSE
jgi:hypothetical protein